jgi:hypothetical protein
MANEEHLKILKQGATAWNQWHKENPATMPDLKCSVGFQPTDCKSNCTNLRDAVL